MVVVFVVVAFETSTRSPSVLSALVTELIVIVRHNQRKHETDPSTVECLQGLIKDVVRWLSEIHHCRWPLPRIDGDQFPSAADKPSTKKGTQFESPFF